MLLCQVVKSRPLIWNLVPMDDIAVQWLEFDTKTRRVEYAMASSGTYFVVKYQRMVYA